MEAEELWEILDADQSGEIDEDRTGRLFVYLLHIWDYTTQLYGGYHKPL